MDFVYLGIPRHFLPGERITQFAQFVSAIAVAIDLSRVNLAHSPKVG